MTLIRSISGIRGTLGGKPGEGLTPQDVVAYVSAYAEILKEKSEGKRVSVLIGRDARISGKMIEALVESTLVAQGIDVYRGGLLTTPTVAMGVGFLEADGGIIITASHNPGQWNALKFLDNSGEFISDTLGKELLDIAFRGAFDYAVTDELGKILDPGDLLGRHIDAILNLPVIDSRAIAASGFKVAIDGVNSVGGEALPRMLEKLGVKDIILLNCEMTGKFPHDPEPLAKNLTDLSEQVKKYEADVGFAVDPDVDRLAIIDETGNALGEEYTLVAVADHILEEQSGPTVSNLSSSMALRDVTEARGQKYYSSAVGEVNVVHKMKEVGAVIGGEGNGGVIYPDLHYGRDALVGVAIFLSMLASRKMTCSRLRAKLPDYFMVKKKVEIKKGLEPALVIQKLKERYASKNIDLTDGIRVDFQGEWVHVRGSNTEPIMRIYAESTALACADKLAGKFIEEISRIEC